MYRFMGSGILCKRFWGNSSVQGCGGPKCPAMIDEGGVIGKLGAGNHTPGCCAGCSNFVYIFEKPNGFAYPGVLL
jgi:hypothetical protein